MNRISRADREIAHRLVLRRIAEVRERPYGELAGRAEQPDDVPLTRGLVLTTTVTRVEGDSGELIVTVSVFGGRGPRLIAQASFSITPDGEIVDSDHYVM